MTFYADLGNKTMVAQGDHIRAIGWLSSDQHFNSGPSSHKFIEKLRGFTSSADWFNKNLLLCCFLGGHTCELCKEYKTYGNIGIPSGSLLYVAPEMISHYVEHHQYKPPDEFINAVLSCPLPGSLRFKIKIRKFRQLKKDYIKTLLSPDSQSEMTNEVIVRAYYDQFDE